VIYFLSFIYGITNLNAFILLVTIGYKFYLYINNKGVNDQNNLGQYNFLSQEEGSDFEPESDEEGSDFEPESEEEGSDVEQRAESEEEGSDIE
jgi:hypothetical protein